MFDKSEVRKMLSFYKKNGYVVIPDALSKEEVIELNRLADDDFKENRVDWKTPERGSFESSNIMTRHPEMDKYTRHPDIFPLLQTILKNEARFSQLDFRDVPLSQVEDGRMPFHRDIAFFGTTGAMIWDPDNPYLSNYVCVIYYLTDVQECCPKFCMAPNTHEYNSIEEAREKMGAEYKEVPIKGKAGTAILYNITTYHTRQAGHEGCTHGRRTLHNYQGRESSPSLTNWVISPEELAMSKSAETMKYYSKWSPAQVRYARDHYKQPMPSYYPVVLFNREDALKNEGK